MLHPPYYCTSRWRRLAFYVVANTIDDFDKRYERARRRELVRRGSIIDRLVTFALYDPREPKLQDWLADDVGDKGVEVPMSLTHKMLEVEGKMGEAVFEQRSTLDDKAEIERIGTEHLYSLPWRKRLRVVFPKGWRRQHWTD